MESASPIGTDRGGGGGCSMSINAYLTLPRLAEVASLVTVPHPTGFRFKYSWSNNFPDSSPTPSRRCNAGRNRNITTESDPTNAGQDTIHRTPLVVAATLTVSHPVTGTSFASGDRVTQPYEHRCRSTCSITLQACHEVLVQQKKQTAPETGNYLNHFRMLRRGNVTQPHQSTTSRCTTTTSPATCCY